MAATWGTLSLRAFGRQTISSPRLTTLSVADARLVRDQRLDPETEAVLKADQYMVRTYRRNGVPLTLLVAYYASQEQGHTTHSPLACLPGTGWNWTDRRVDRIAIDDRRSIEINRNVATRAGDPLLIYYWYQSRDRVVASEYTNKVLLVGDALLKHRSDGALVRVTSPWTDEDADQEAIAFIRDLYPALSGRLSE